MLMRGTRLVCAALVWTGLALLCGCSKTPAANDPLAGAPAEWGGFLDWAATRLQTFPDAVPLPKEEDLPRIRPRWKVVPLVDRTPSVKSDWKHADTPLVPLASIRDAGSGHPSPTVGTQVRKRATQDGGDALALVMRGFQVQREQVGTIALEVRIPFGRQFVLKWAKAGEITVPVLKHDAPFALAIPTDEFAEWEGSLSTIFLVTDGQGQGEVRVNRMDFLPRTNSYPLASGVKRVKLGEEIRSVRYVHAPGSLRFPLRNVPARARLQLGLGAAGGSIDVEILVDDAGAIESLDRRSVDAGSNWADVRLALAKYAGKDVALELRATSGSDEAVALFANPVVYEALPAAPVVVVYLVDTLAGEHVYLYGYQRNTTPRIASLAEHGVFFSDMVSNSSRTLESIPDLMLSMPTERHGVWHNLTPTPKELVTLAEMLRKTGFATASFCTNVNAGPRQGMDQGFDQFYDKIGYWWTKVDRTVPLEDVTRFLDMNIDRPTFLYVHTAEPHAPYAPPPGYAGRFDPDYKGDIDGTYDRRTGFRARIDPRNAASLRRDLRHVRSLYDEEVLYADARFGAFMDLLDKRGLGQRTTLFVTSDHGEEFLQHRMWEHGLDLHNELTRVPLIVAGPDFSARGVIDAPVQTMDIMPTILDMYDLPHPYRLNGRSFLPLLIRSATTPERAIASPAEGASDAQMKESSDSASGERMRFGSNHNYRNAPQFKLIEYYAIQGNHWKIVYGLTPYPSKPGGAPSRFALYDLHNDPHERTSVLALNKPLARQLIGKLVAWRSRQAAYDPGERQASFSLGVSKTLTDLGYLGGGDDEAGDEDEDN